MSVIEQSKDLEKEIKNLQKVKKDKDTNSVFQRILTEIETLLEESKKINTSHTTLSSQKRGLSNTSLGHIKIIQDGCEKYENSLSNDDLIQSQWGPLKKVLDEKIKSFESELKGEWKELIDQEFPKFEAYTSFEEFNDQVKLEIKKLKKLKQEIEIKDGICWPVSDDNLKNIIKKSEEAQKIIDEINLGQVPVAVKEFLAKCSGYGADLENLTDEILTWLKENDFMSKLKVKTSDRGFGR